MSVDTFITEYTESTRYSCGIALATRKGKSRKELRSEERSWREKTLLTRKTHTHTNGRLGQISIHHFWGRIIFPLLSAPSLTSMKPSSVASSRDESGGEGEAPLIVVFLSLLTFANALNTRFEHRHNQFLVHRAPLRLNLDATLCDALAYRHRAVSVALPVALPLPRSRGS